MRDNLKFSLKTTGLTILACGAATVLTFIQIMIIGEDNSNLLMMNPLLSGYLHLSVPHFISNMLLIFLALCSDINQKYTLLKIFYVTLIIEMIYLPLEVLELSQIARGISGTCYFLISRFFFSWREKAWLGASIAVVLALIEFNGFFSAPDDAAHGVHLLGIFLGFISLPRERKSSPKLLPQ